MNQDSPYLIIKRFLIIGFWSTAIFFIPIFSVAQNTINLDSASTNTVKLKTVEPSQIIDLSHKLLVSTGVLFKAYTIKIENVNSGKSMDLDPTGSANIGFGINYKWLGIGVSIGLPSGANETRRFGETEKQDFQLNVYSNSFVAQGHMQHYKGFHVSDLDIGDSTRSKLKDGEGIMSGLEAYSLGFSGWYIINNKKFSYKAAYVRNAIQTKSAGSIVVGLYYGLDKANAGTSFGESLPDTLQDYFGVVGYNSQSFGISAGYTYTFVIKKFFVNGTIVPGLGVKNVLFSTPQKNYKIDEGLTGRIVLNFSTGYEAKHFLVGIRMFTSTRLFEANGFRVGTGTNSFTLFIGKRFNVSKKKKRTN